MRLIELLFLKRQYLAQGTPKCGSVTLLLVWKGPRPLVADVAQSEEREPLQSWASHSIWLAGPHRLAKER